MVEMQGKIKSRISCLSRNPSLYLQSCTIRTISSKFNNCVLVALMKHLIQANHLPPVTLSSNQAKWPNPNNDNRGTEHGCMLWCLTKCPCNRSHQIQLRSSSCDAHIGRGISFLHIYGEIQLLLKRVGKNFHSIPFFCQTVQNLKWNINTSIIFNI